MNKISNQSFYFNQLVKFTKLGINTSLEKTKVSFAGEYDNIYDFQFYVKTDESSLDKNLQEKYQYLADKLFVE